MFVFRFCTAVIMLITLAPVMAYSGSLDSPAAPTGTSSAMYTLTDIYNRLDTGTATAKRTGAFTEPSSGPAATGKTLDDVMGLVNSRAPVAKTGQTTLYVTGDDGDLEKGVTWPNPRFTDNGNGTVTDNLTGLIWLRNANAGGAKNWADALSYCDALSSGTSTTDGSSLTDWRLPNVKELPSLIDYGRNSPALPNTAGAGQWTEGNPFSGVQSANYWSGSTRSADTTEAWYVSLLSGYVGHVNKSTTYYVWPVRAGQ